MKMDESKIENLLRQTQHPEPSANLYTRLESDLPRAEVADPVFPMLWIRRLAPVSFLLIAIVASAAGVFIMTHARYKKMEQLPENLPDVRSEPYVQYGEDIQPIPLVLHDNIMEMMQLADKQQAATGKRTRWTLLDIEPDGTNHWWTEDKRFFNDMAKSNYQSHNTMHPNIMRGRWYYNLDGSQILIKSVVPKHDATNGDGFLITWEKPKSEIVVCRTVLFERSCAQPFGSQWKVELKRFQFGDSFYLFMAVKLPKGAKLENSSRPFTRQTLGPDERQTLWYDGGLEPHVKVPPLTITYTYQAETKANANYTRR